MNIDVFDSMEKEKRREKDEDKKKKVWKQNKGE